MFRCVHLASEVYLQPPLAFLSPLGACLPRCIPCFRLFTVNQDLPPVAVHRHHQLTLRLCDNNQPVIS